MHLNKIDPTRKKKTDSENIRLMLKSFEPMSIAGLVVRTSASKPSGSGFDSCYQCSIIFLVSVHSVNEYNGAKIAVAALLC